MNSIKKKAYFLIFSLLLLATLLYTQGVYAGTIILKKRFPGVIVKVVEVQGPNITELGGSIPAYHNVRIQAEDGDVIIRNISFTNLQNMGFKGMGKQNVEGMHLGRAVNKSYYKTLFPIKSYEEFSWLCDLDYTYKGRDYDFIIDNVNSSEVQKEKPRFRKNDGTDELAASLGIGLVKTYEVTDSGDLFSTLEEELNLKSSKYNSRGRFTSEMDIALEDVEQHVERMRMIASHNAMLDKEAERIIERAKSTEKMMRRYAEIHQAQDAEARRIARAREEAKKKENSGGFRAALGVVTAIAGSASGLSTSDALEAANKMMNIYDNNQNGGNLVGALEELKNSYPSIEETNRQQAKFYAQIQEEIKQQQRSRPGSFSSNRNRAQLSQFQKQRQLPRESISSDSRSIKSVKKGKKRSAFDVNWCCFSLTCGNSQVVRDYVKYGTLPSPKYPTNQACNNNKWSKSYGGRR